MIHLEMNGHRATIEAGELIGYEVKGHQFIHQKGSPGWSSADTEMFPIIGPVNEAGFEVKVPLGNAIQDQHGHLRQFAYTLISSSATEAVFKKTYKAGTPIKNSKYPSKSSEEWLAWPYSFEFEKHFKLCDGFLEIKFVISGDDGMPFMLGYHPAFKLYTNRPVIKTNTREITLDEVLAVGSRALQVADHDTLTLKDEKEITIKTKGFGHFMCWTEVKNMVCIEPITFYPYAVAQKDLNKGFQYLEGTSILEVSLHPEI
ncbi:aldose epimerase [Moorena bouillonii]|uniref:Aldose epimerase n=1 Tax=Moorena bouillonii PNG TaxID=568701 RepID=A0A1U7N2G1_9CYAN|nr:aldose epimerase [Moorena bouillonii]OLT60132.1 aldose epimerase [Moorena bouillonii PNG]